MFFGFSNDNKTLYIILGIIIVLGIMSMGANAILSLALTIPGVVLAITFHEYAHALAAYKLGDDTPKIQGRLNLNPFSHLDPFGIAMLLFVHIGWGKPVEINPRNFNSNISLAKAEAIVSAAGPITNILLAIILTIINVIIVKFVPMFVVSEVGFIIMLILQNAIVVNIGLGVFNLIPLPPLDGSKIFINFMPYNAKQWIYNNERMLYIIFLVLWITGLAGTIISPIINAIYSGITWCVSVIFGLL